MLKKTVKNIVLSVIIIALFSTSAFAAINASKYITRTSVGISVINSNTVDVSFSITGTGYMDKIGAAVVTFYKSDGTHVATYSYTNTTYSYMMAYNTYIHAGDVTYTGTPGESYYARVDFYAEKDGGADSHSMATGIVTIPTT